MSGESWGRSITPNEPEWVGAVIDSEIDRRDREIERLRAENNSLRWQLTELGQRLQIALDDASEWERAARGET